MYRTNGVIEWIITFISIFAIFYLMLLFLPVILLIIGGYVLYIWVKVWLIKRRLKNTYYQFDIEEENQGNGKVIDAEFEILDEKNH